MKKTLCFLAILHILAGFAVPASAAAPRVAAESVDKGSAAEKAGVLPGDLLVSFEVQGPAGGKVPVRSPFSLVELETEWAPRGPVSLEISRNGSMLLFQLVSENIGISAVPVMPPRQAARFGEATAILKGGRNAEAAVLLRELSAEFASKDDRETACWLLLKAGEALRSAKKHAEAAELFAQAALEADHPGKAAARWKALILQGDALRYVNQAGKASEVYLAACELSRGAFGETLFLAGALSKCGALAASKGDTASASDFHGRSLAICEKLAPDSLVTAVALANLGLAAKREGNLVLAGELYGKAVALTEKLAPESAAMANILTNLGGLELEKGRFQAAGTYYSRSLSIREKLSPGSMEVAGALNNLGIVASRNGDMAGALDHFRRALKIRETLSPGSVAVADTLNNLGSISLNRGDLEEAEDLYKRALGIREQLSAGSLECATILSNIGNIVLIRGDNEGARELYGRALEIRNARAPVSLDVASSLTDLGDVEVSAGEPAKAEELYGKALEICLKLAPESVYVANILNNLGHAAELRGDLASAQDFLSRALLLREKLTPGALPVAVIHNNLGTLAEARGELGSAESSFGKALEIAVKVAPGSIDEAEVLYNMGLLALKTGSTAKASEYLSRTVSAFESQMFRLGGGKDTREGFSAKYSDYYRDLADTQATSGKNAEAFLTLEKFRARNLLEMLSERDLDFARDAPADLLREQKELAFAFAGIQDRLSQLSPEKDGGEIGALLEEARTTRKKQEEVEAAIRRSSPKLASLRHPSPLDHVQAAELFERDTLFLSYCAGRERTLLFALLNGELRTYVIPAGRDRLRAEAAALRRLLSDPSGDRKELEKSISRLRGLLMKPARALVRRASSIVVCPDGPLHYFPLAVLARGKPCSTVISATVLSEISRREDTAGRRAVAFGNPDYGTAYPLLPSTEAEVASIKELFGDEMKAFTGASATEERAREECSGKDIIHFACHGILDERFPLNSSLALTIPHSRAEGSGNGLLQAWEIFESVRINADLVTLSACETGLGKEMGGEGLIGLTRAFQYAGAGSVLSSLWKVSDESTALLMKSFYSHLRAGRKRAEALMLAQNEMAGSGKYSHPFYWAGFVLNGSSE